MLTPVSNVKRAMGLNMALNTAKNAKLLLVEGANSPVMGLRLVLIVTEFIQKKD